MRVAALLLIPALLVAARPGDEPKQHGNHGDKVFVTTIQPFLATHCHSCHAGEKAAGGLSLDVYQSEAHARKDRKTWESIQRVVLSGEMPPERAKSQPTAEARKQFADWIAETLTKVDCTGPRNPGRVTLRRLNRAEYNNTIRDLVGVAFKPAEDFPSDDVGYGFDNIGDVLSMQPLMIEKYLAAAERILDTALPDGQLIKPTRQVFRPQQLRTEPRSAKTRGKDDRGREIDRIALREAGLAFMEKIHFPADARYAIRARVRGESDGEEMPKLALRIGNRELKTFTVGTKWETFETTVELTASESRVAATFFNPGGSRVLHVDSLEIEGPLGADAFLPNAKQQILKRLPNKADNKEAAARATLTEFARRAYRRPVRADEVDRLVALFNTAHQRGERFDQALKLPLKAVLVSPHFLFRIEDDPKAPEEIRVLNDHELAVRLSYFLWSSMPDAELFTLAEQGSLRKPGTLEAQVKRMLADPKAEALTTNFAGQWLMLRNIADLAPDRASFPKWDAALQAAIVRETELLFEHILRGDRSVLEFLDCDYTFVNERLALHYGIRGVKGPEFRRVDLPDRRRGGLVTHASMLAVTSNPTRTSPVKRGKWIYENILGLTAPPPAPDVPELPETAEIRGTLREQMEQHRANPNCAVCHNKLDPLGFGLENFDGIGAWRDVDNRKRIDASGVLPDGAAFDGPAELRRVLVGKADQFRRCLAEKMLTYALGRGLEYYDKCVLDDLAKRLQDGGDRFSALIIGIVESDPFQKRRGRRDN